jgi:HTH-type transcriptional regulator/antitoxin HipB
MQTLVSEQTLGYLLKDARMRRRLTQAEAGKCVGLDQTVISRIENGRHALRVDTLFKILAALDYEMLIQPREDGGHEQKGDAW